MVFKKGMAVSPLHARQLVSHGHVMVGNRRITIPGYEVEAQEEGTVVLVGAKEVSQAAAPPGQEQQAEAAAK
jgi:small subunit ribosomal protein S4